MSTDTSTAAARFRDMHTEGLLVLPNAWDAASARIAEAAGATAVATTSAGMAWSLGHPDGNWVPRELMVDAVRRVVDAVGVPVTADIETGYGDSVADVRTTVRSVVAAGAAGINIEDSGVQDSGTAPLRDIMEQAARIAVVRSSADDEGVPLFVNARIDTFLLQAGDPTGRMAETVARATAFVDAGADGIFVPGLLDADALRELAAQLTVPLNVMAGPGAPSVPELADLGVRRVSVGSGIAQAAYAVARRAAHELLTGGTYTALQDGLDYGELNALLS